MVNKMANEKQAEYSGWTLNGNFTIRGFILMLEGVALGAVTGLMLELHILAIICLALVAGFVTLVLDGLNHSSFTRTGSWNPTAPARRAPNDQKTTARPEPALKKEDLEWTRDGDDIRGQYRDFVIYIRTSPRTRSSGFHVTVQVLRSGTIVAADTVYSHREAIERGLLAVRNHLDAERESDKTFDMLTGNLSSSRNHHSPASTVNRSRRDFQRYMA